MTNLKRKIATTLGAAAVFAATAVPAFAGENYGSNYGGYQSNYGSYGSRSHFELDYNNTTTINQSNSSNVDNNISVRTNTGGNRGGGDIHTGDATSTVSVHNGGNFNFAHVGCGCEFGGHELSHDSDNNHRYGGNFDIDFHKRFSLNQRNFSDFENNIDVHTNTGGNYGDDHDYTKYSHEDIYKNYWKWLKYMKATNDHSYSWNWDGWQDWKDWYDEEHNDNDEKSIHTGDASSTVEVKNHGPVNIYDGS